MPVKKEPRTAEKKAEKRAYMVEVFVNEQPQEAVTFECWDPWTAVHRAFKVYRSKIKETHRVNQKLTARCTRIK